MRVTWSEERRASGERRASCVTYEWRASGVRVAREWRASGVRGVERHHFDTNSDLGPRAVRMCRISNILCRTLLTPSPTHPYRTRGISWPGRTVNRSRPPYREICIRCNFGCSLGHVRSGCVGEVIRSVRHRMSVVRRTHHFGVESAVRVTWSEERRASGERRASCVTYEWRASGVTCELRDVRVT